LFGGFANFLPVELTRLTLISRVALFGHFSPRPSTSLVQTNQARCLYPHTREPHISRVLKLRDPSPRRPLGKAETVFSCTRSVRLFAAFHVSNVAPPNFSTTKKMRLCYRVAGYRFGCGLTWDYIVSGNGSRSRGDKERTREEQKKK